MTADEPSSPRPADPTYGPDGTLGYDAGPAGASRGRLDTSGHDGQGRIHLLSVIGTGGMGVVHRAYDRVLRKEVATKTLFAAGPEQAYRLKQEFRRLHGVSHGNLVSLYDLFVEARNSFFTMELVDGTDLVRHVRGDARPGTLPDAAGLSELRRVLRELAEGIAALHRAGLLHRDIKPSNILVSREGRVVILDFGVAALLHRRADGDREHVVGTPAWLAPEATLGHPPEPGLDWYGVGVVLYEALVGSVPFHGSIHEMVGQKRFPPSVAEVVPGAPEELDELVYRLLTPDPEQRAGYADLVTALGHPAGRPLADDLPPPPLFVGRAREIQALREAVRRTRGSGPAVVHVRGPSGIGKTELVSQLVDELRAWPHSTVLTGRCLANETVPFKALDSLVDQMSRHLLRLPDATTQELVPHHAGALLSLFPVLERVPALALWKGRDVPGEARERRIRGFGAMREILAHIAALGPLFLWIDDAQWGDEESAHLLRDVIGAAEPPDLVLLLSYRSEGPTHAPALAPLWEPVPGRDVLFLDVHPLGRDATAEMARQMGGRVDPGVIEAVVEQSGGSPFFVGELVRHALRRGGTGPVRVSDAIVERLREVDPDARALLDAAAVAGAPTHLEFLVAAAGVDLDRAAVYRLRDRSLLRAVPGQHQEIFETWHDRIREALLQALTPERSRELHARLARALEESGTADPCTLARLLRGAGQNAEAARWALIGADDARAALAFERAVALYQDAIDLRPGGDTDWELHASLASALSLAGRGAAAGAAYERASRLAEQAGIQDDRRVSLLGRAAEALLCSGRHAEGKRLLREVLGALDVPVPPTAAAATRAMLWLRVRLLWRGLAFHPADRPAEPSLLARLDALWGCTRGTAMTEHVLSDALAVRHLMEALDLGERSRALRALGLEAVAEANLGTAWLVKRSREILATCRELLEKGADPYDEAWVRASEGGVAWFLGDWAASAAACAEAGETFRTRCTKGAWWEATVADVFLLSALALMGRTTELSARLPALRRAADARGDSYAGTALRAGDLMIASLAEDDADRALAAADTAIAGWPSDTFTSLHFGHLLGSVTTQLYRGDFADARGRVEAAWPLVKGAGLLASPCVAALLHLLRARTALAVGDSALAAAEARALEASSLDFAHAAGAAVTGVLAGRNGVPALERAIAGFDAAGMHAYREAARVRRAAAAGEGESREAAAWMRAAMVRRPERFVVALLPLLPG